MKMMQRAYVLNRKGGELIFLFEERALATMMESSMFADIVADLVARAGVALRELGTVRGRRRPARRLGYSPPQNGRHRP